MQNTSRKPLFDLRKMHAKRARAMRMGKTDADFLAKIAADTIAERLDVVQREFEVVVDLHSMFGCMHQNLSSLTNVKNATAFGTWPAEPMGLSSVAIQQNAYAEALPFEPGSLSLVTSIFGLHWMNDLPGTLAQIKHSLKPDGLFMAAIPGDQTLRELREALIEAETRLTGGVSLRVDPYGEVRQLGGLLQRAGFALPVVDTDILTVRYKSLAALINDLRAMGVAGSLTQGNGFAGRRLFEETEKIYRERHGDEDGKITASFEIVYLSGWAPHASQQKPLKPGSAAVSLSKFL